METKQTQKNKCLKERKVEEPYEIWKTPNGRWEWRVLKKWQIDDDKPYARWFCAVKSPLTFNGFDYGDVYVKEIKESAIKVCLKCGTELKKLRNQDDKEINELWCSQCEKTEEEIKFKEIGQ